MDGYTFEQADKDLFAVYQTIYSQADVGMAFSWEARLNDTKWSDDCYFLCRGGEKLGGAIISDGLVMFAFTIPPFCDHYLFWELLLRRAREATAGEQILLRGALAGAVPVLLNYGARIWRIRQSMCRPTDTLAYSLPEGISIETPKEADIPALADAQARGYAGGISHELFGAESPQEIAEDLKKAFDIYAASGSLEQFAVARRVSDGAIAGACVAGIDAEMPNGFAFIREVFVLPEFRRQGLAQAMLRHTITAAHQKTAAIKLHVLVGNPAAGLYRKLGFVAGPVFTDMRLTL